MRRRRWRGPIRRPLCSGMTAMREATCRIGTSGRLARIVTVPECAVAVPEMGVHIGRRACPEQCSPAEPLCRQAARKSLSNFMISTRSAQRKFDEERSPLAGLSFGGDSTTVSFHDATHDRQTDSRACVLGLAVQAAERSKQ